MNLVLLTMSGLYGSCFDNVAHVFDLDFSNVCIARHQRTQSCDSDMT